MHMSGTVVNRKGDFPDRNTEGIKKGKGPTKEVSSKVTTPDTEFENLTRRGFNATEESEVRFVWEGHMSI